MLSELLVRTIESELSWRERELAFCKLQLLRDISDTTRFEFSYRCFVAITYAHFEGFVKRIVAHALIDIRNSGAKPSECTEVMRPHLFASALRRRLSAQSNAELLTSLGRGSQLLDELSYPSEDTIMDCGNMNVSNFEWATSCIGIDSKSFFDFRPYIGHIVNLRHSGAHGERISFDSSKSNAELAGEIFETQTQIITLMHALAVEIITSFEKDLFRISSSIGGS